MQHLVPELHVALLPVAQEAGRLGGTTGPDLSRYFLVCAILIAVTGGVAWGLKKLLAHNLQVRASQRSLKVIDVLGLGGKRQVAVVRCYDRTFVLGLGERDVSPIAELDPIVGAGEPAAAPRPADRAAFAQALEQVRKALPKPKLGAARGALPLQPAADSPAPAAQAEAAAPITNAAITATALADANVQPLPKDEIEPRLQAELERRYRAASQRLAANDGRLSAGAPATSAAPTADAKPKRVLRKVLRKRSPEESERARSVASAALEMAATMRREQAAAARGADTEVAPAAGRAADSANAARAANATNASRDARADAVAAPLPASSTDEERPALRLEGVLG